MNTVVQPDIIIGLQLLELKEQSIENMTEETIRIGEWIGEAISAGTSSPEEVHDMLNEYRGLCTDLSVFKLEIHMLKQSLYN